jgi:hypothetical protein
MSKVVIDTEGKDLAGPETREVIPETGYQKKKVTFAFFEAMGEAAGSDQDDLSNDMRAASMVAGAFKQGLDAVVEREKQRPKEAGRKRIEHDLVSAGQLTKAFFKGLIG